jgi:thioredoxin-like negative regulator of GroEL
MATDIDPAELERALEATRGAGAAHPLVVDFYAAHCTPCLTQEPLVVGLEIDIRSYGDVVKLDVTGADALVERFRLTTLPTVIVFADGRERARFPGLTDRGALAAAVVEIARKEGRP